MRIVTGSPPPFILFAALFLEFTSSVAATATLFGQPSRWSVTPSPSASSAQSVPSTVAIVNNNASESAAAISISAEAENTAATNSPDSLVTPVSSDQQTVNVPQSIPNAVGWIAALGPYPPEIPLPPRYAFKLSSSPTTLSNTTSSVWRTQDLSGIVYTRSVPRAPLSAALYMVKWNYGLTAHVYEESVKELEDKIARVLAWPSSVVKVGGIKYKLKGASLEHEIKFDGGSGGKPIFTGADGAFRIPTAAIDASHIAGLRHGDVLKYQFTHPNGSVFAGPVPAGEVRAIGERGWSIISDIDDTLRMTGVLDLTVMFRTTFIDPFRAVPGMVGLYRTWMASLTDDPTGDPDVSAAAVHYLSGSPIALLRPVMSFLGHHGFPLGPLHLFEHTVSDVQALKTLKDVARYKLSALHQIAADFPHREFILVGDSGQSDPQAYGNLFREVRKQRENRTARWCIYIRAVSGVNAKKEAERNTAARFRWDFRDIPAHQWVVFKKPEDIVAADPKSGNCYPKGKWNPYVEMGGELLPTQPAMDSDGNAIKSEWMESKENAGEFGALRAALGIVR